MVSSCCSSIASFVAFTIGLMSLAAPPHLIEKSLQAASDELQHAKKSFEMASLLRGGQILEPGQLPPTRLEFGNNLILSVLRQSQNHAKTVAILLNEYISLLISKNQQFSNFP